MSNYSAIDMTTAAAQGFRDGVASVANSAIPNNQDASAAQGQQVEWRTTAVMLEQANAGLAQLNGKLRAEREALHAEAEALRGLTPELPPRPPEGAGLPRYGLRWNGPAQPLSVPMDDGYWTPWHLAEALRAENAALRESSQDVRSLVEALEECAASLAWNCLGECRAIHAGPIMPAAMALDTARAALSASRVMGNSDEQE